MKKASVRKQKTKGGRKFSSKIVFDLAIDQDLLQRRFRAGGGRRCLECQDRCSDDHPSFGFPSATALAAPLASSQSIMPLMPFIQGSISSQAAMVMSHGTVEAASEFDVAHSAVTLGHEPVSFVCDLQSVRRINTGRHIGTTAQSTNCRAVFDLH